MSINFRRLWSFIYLQGDSPVILSSKECIYQGDPLGPIWFATAIQELLTKLLNDHPCVVVLAYLDDVFQVGLPDNVLAVFEDVKPMFHYICLDIQDTKCEFYNPLSVEIESHTYILITTKGMSILGIPVGKKDYM